MTWQLRQQVPFLGRQSSRWIVPRNGSPSRVAFGRLRAPIAQQLRYASTTDDSQNNDSAVPYRQQYKMQRKDDKHSKLLAQLPDANDDHEWKLTVGIEIHAELDVERKLFSTAPATATDSPNVNISINDLAYPGAQPLFQPAVLIPAIRAALSLGCTINRTSTFDRKHYFYQDQPAGYQITQFYKPFASNGSVSFDNIQTWPEDVKRTVEIQQVQLEQDTAKSLVQGNDTVLLDFNRVSHPLIEIISRPDMHSPEDAASFVKTVQQRLRAVGAVTAGMETGALRADVNVSVSRKPRDGEVEPPLGQRVEIKNLSSFKGIYDAVSAEKRRQIEILRSGGTIAAETRGWTLGGKTTHKLRGKEGEVDYRYMPDPDIQPLVISDDLIRELIARLPNLPNKVARDLNMAYGLTIKDASTLMLADDGARLDYFDSVVSQAVAIVKADPKTADNPGLVDTMAQAKAGKIAGNLILHETGALLTKTGTAWSEDLVPASQLAVLVALRLQERIHVLGVKTLLAHVFNNEHSARTADLIELATSLNLIYADDGGADYNEQNLQKVIVSVAREAFKNDLKVRLALDKATAEGNTRRREGKMNFFVGRAMHALQKKGLWRYTNPTAVRAVVEDVYEEYFGSVGSGKYAAADWGDKPVKSGKSDS